MMPLSNIQKFLIFIMHSNQPTNKMAENDGHTKLTIQNIYSQFFNVNTEDATKSIEKMGDEGAYNYFPPLHMYHFILA